MTLIKKREGHLSPLGTSGCTVCKTLVLSGGTSSSWKNVWCHSFSISFQSLMKPPSTGHVSFDMPCFCIASCPKKNCGIPSRRAWCRNLRMIIMSELWIYFYYNMGVINILRYIYDTIFGAVKLYMVALKFLSEFNLLLNKIPRYNLGLMQPLMAQVCDRVTLLYAARLHEPKSRVCYRPTAVGKIFRGKDSEANPALVNFEPRSMTTPIDSSKVYGDMVLQSHIMLVPTTTITPSRRHHLDWR